ncbi:histidine kinase [Amycolatopsis sp. cg5]|uniref:hypothetical protein n=1 Tax=Amycolatopsis sp. cg5 TaxID=3238802 RepID=UPI0035256750
MTVAQRFQLALLVVVAATVARPALETISIASHWIITALVILAAEAGLALNLLRIVRNGQTPSLGTPAALAVLSAAELLVPGWNAVSGPGFLACAVLLTVGPQGPQWARAAFAAVVALAVPFGEIWWDGPATTFVTGGFLYLCAQALRVARELDESRTELIAFAVDSERSRLTTDVESALSGHLAAITAGTEQARILAAHDPSAAAREIKKVVTIARKTGAEVRRIARGYRETSFAGEVAAAADLFAAAGIDCRTEVAAVPNQLRKELTTELHTWVNEVLSGRTGGACAIELTSTEQVVRLTMAQGTHLRQLHFPVGDRGFTHSG